MNKWEYFFLTVQNYDVLEPNQYSPLANIKSLGEKGWELVAITNYSQQTIFAFKRLIQE